MKKSLWEKLPYKSELFNLQRLAVNHFLVDILTFVSYANNSQYVTLHELAKVINIVQVIKLNRSKHFPFSVVGQIHPHAEFEITSVDSFNNIGNFTSGNYAMCDVGMCVNCVLNEY